MQKCLGQQHVFDNFQDAVQQNLATYVCYTVAVVSYQISKAKHEGSAKHAVLPSAADAVIASYLASAGTSGTLVQVAALLHNTY